jgi:hypothetical protein
MNWFECSQPGDQQCIQGEHEGISIGLCGEHGTFEIIEECEHDGSSSCSSEMDDNGVWVSECGA